MGNKFSVQFFSQRMLSEDEHPDVVFSMSNEGLATLLNNDYRGKFKPIDGSGSAYYCMKNGDFDAFIDQASQYVRKPMDYVEIKNDMRPNTDLGYEPKKGSLKEDAAPASTTGTGASFSPGTGEQYAPGLDVSNKKKRSGSKKTKRESKDYSQRYQGTQTTVSEKNNQDVEPKLAAGNAKNYAKDKMGWTPATKIPNRPTKGGFIYKELWEQAEKNLVLEEGSLKREIKVRNEKQQYREAIKLAKKKLSEANKILEISEKIKEEFPNGPFYEAKSKKVSEGLKSQVAEIYKRIKRL